MGFLTGRATYMRFRAEGGRPDTFGEEHIARLDEHRAGRQRIASADGIEIGWTAGGHVLDLDFTLAKNVVNDALCFELRVDTDKLPADKLKAYYEIELKALAANNPSGFASARQKREAKQVSRERLEDEAKDGRYRKQKCVPVLWDGKSGEVLFGATSLSHVDRFLSLFKQTFGVGAWPLTAGPQSQLDAPNAHMRFIGERAGYVGSPSPSAFVPGVSPSEIAWIPDAENRDFLGNEFALWLWYRAEGDSDTIKVSDGSEVTYMLARKLVVECPRGQTGADAFAHEGPSRLPEAKRAIQSGKLPRKVGLTLVRHDQQYELTLLPELLAVGSAKLPAPPEDVGDARARLDCRVGQMRDLVETCDLLYAAFLEVRLSAKWDETLKKMQRWLAREERAAA